MNTPTLRLMAAAIAILAVVSGGQIDGLAAAAPIVSSLVGVAVVRVLAGSATTVVPRIESWLSNA